ncbi:autotransporter assembly complex protein TamA [Marinicauda pacifica]|uniref:autotransporter assembly complex protein TamA n=1 Tax=Marinicauda pacifica TaxID=1133559 RepID=UPI0035C840BB
MSDLPSSTRAIFSRLSGAALLACALCAPALGKPQARIEGVEDAALRDALYQTIGEAEEEAESRWAARDMAQQAAERIRLYLESRGYYAALVDPRLGENDTPLVRVRPGVQFVFESVDVAFDVPADSERAPGAEIESELGLQAGRPVLASAVIDAENRVLTALRNSGWIQAETGNREIIVDHATEAARATFAYDTGPFLRFGTPQLAGGLADLDEEYVRRLAPFEAGEPASKAQLEEYNQRLQNLEIVALADTRLAPNATGVQRPVDVRMEPVPRHTLAVAARFSTDRGAGGQVEWIRRNMFNRDETLTLDVSAATLQSGVEATLQMPHWRRYNQALTLTGAALAERTDAYDQDALSAGAALSRVLTDELTVSAGIDTQIARVEDARGERDLATVTLPLEAVFDMRDSVLNPLDGVYTELRVRPGMSFGDEEARYVRSVFGLRGYQTFGESWTLAARVRLGALFGATAQEVPPTQRFYAGGGGSIRGYEYQSVSPPLLDEVTGREEPFGGRSLFETSAELRYRWSDRLGFVTFVDGGIAGRELSPDFGEMQYAAGFGVRYYPGFGPIRADIATPLNPRDGDDPVHFYISIGQAF